MPERTNEQVHYIFDMACDILQRTNDGDDLDPIQLKFIEDAVNGFLNERGIEVLKELHKTVISGQYKKPPFHGMEHLTIDHLGFIYWKGHQVEHYEFPWAYIKEAQQATIELARRCEVLESRGTVPSINSAIRNWPE